MSKESIGLILEGLSKGRKDLDEVAEFFESLRSSSSLDIGEEYNYFPLTEGDEEEAIDEAEMVTFGGGMYPKCGYAVIMTGGSGSGKSYVRKTKLAIDAKTIDVDELKELYMKAAKQGRIKDDKDYDMKNPEDVSDLHKKVKDKGYKEKREDAFFGAHDNSSRPNVIYDITGDNPNKLEGIGKKLKEMGYKISLVWVVTSRQVAMLQNISRSRVVSQKVFHETHNAVATSVFPFLKKGAKDYDEAWIVFNSKSDAKTISPEERKELSRMGSIKLVKKGNGFEIPRAVEERLYEVLGPMETNPDHPEVYRDFGTLVGNTEEINKIRQGGASLLAKAVS